MNAPSWSRSDFSTDGEYEAYVIGLIRAASIVAGNLSALPPAYRELQFRSEPVARTTLVAHQEILAEVKIGLTGFGLREARLDEIIAEGEEAFRAAEKEMADG